MLEQKGYRVIEASDGLQAVEAATQDRPDVILMDLDMPRMDGFEAMRHARASAELETVPIVALTAHDKADFRDRASTAGFDQYITKPIDFQRLDILIQKLLPAR
jgi:CheY-like chemotaxis protein